MHAASRLFFAETEFAKVVLMPFWLVNHVGTVLITERCICKHVLRLWQVHMRCVFPLDVQRVRTPDWHWLRRTFDDSAGMPLV